ncbi:MAG TPA: hypothetical protein VNT31_02525 [Nocardioides sp.]|nr:hypothetical protein [Nocardioides sp.]
MRVRRSAAAALGLLALLPVLAACGEDASGYGDGDLVPARDDAQFSNGTESVLALPIGRLEVFLGEPTDRLEAEDTRALEATAAPDGSTFVPITWQYDAGTFGDYADYVASDETPQVELLADDARYRLPAPQETGKGAESFYVLVAGTASDLRLEVTYDEVAQSVDLRTGEREPGAAAGLYDLGPRSSRARDCSAGADFNDTIGLPDYSCRVTAPVRLPYADGRWAGEGRTFLAVTVTTAVRRFDVLGPLPGSGAIYAPASVSSTFELDGREPVSSVQDVVDTCPAPGGIGCTGRYHLVFEVEDGARNRLAVEQTFNLLLGSRWGDVEREDRLDLDVSLDVRLKPAARR